MIKNISITTSDGRWWTMEIEYQDGQGVFGCNRPSLKEILKELEWRINNE